MTTFTEVLPVRTSSKNSAINWRPVADNAFSHVAGVVTIHTDRASAAYIVNETPSGWTGRAFTFRKATAGTDASEESYSVYCQPTRPAATSCDCKGHTRFLHCKHADAANALVANGWL